MSNRHQGETEMQRQSQEVPLQKIQDMSQNTGSLTKLKGIQEDLPAMSGSFLFRDFGDGFSMHITDATEQQDAQSSVELQACISVNILFAGAVEFCLGEDRIQLSGDKYRTQPTRIECCAIILSRPEIMTRYLKRGQNVRKINLSMSRTWIEKRARSSAHTDQLNTLFQQHRALIRWRPNAVQARAYQTLLRLKEPSGLAGELQLEQQFMQLANQFIEQLLAQLPAIDSRKLPHSLINSDTDRALLKTLEKYLHKGCSLPEIAEASNISISTLQRKIKKATGMTVKEYIRIRRLESAKTAITLGGLSIGEAAFKAGYNHSSNFIAAFKKQFFITPAELIKNHQRPI